MSTQISYIKNIIENEYGITSPQAYVEYKKRKTASGLTLDEVNRLSPDTIDSGSFWEYIENESVFNRDAVAYGYKNTEDINTINAHNYHLACCFGILNYIFARHSHKLNLLDIGVGYGFLKNLVESSTKFNYYGVDVCPKIDGIYKIKDCILPYEILELKYELIVSSNVFQHLSVRQRNMYYEQIAQILHPQHGIFSVSNSYHTNNKIGFFCNENGKQYVCHYGQYTELQSLQEIVDDLSKHFKIIAHSFLEQHNVTFHCQLKNNPN